MCRVCNQYQHVDRDGIFVMSHSSNLRLRLDPSDEDWRILKTLGREDLFFYCYWLTDREGLLKFIWQRQIIWWGQDDPRQSHKVTLTQVEQKISLDWWREEPKLWVHCYKVAALTKNTSVDWVRDGF